MYYEYQDFSKPKMAKRRITR